MKTAKTAVHRAFYKALFSTKVPRLNELGHQKGHDWFNRRIVFEVLRELGWEHTEAIKGASKFKGIARDRLQLLFPTENFIQPHTKRNTKYKLGQT